MTIQTLTATSLVDIKAASTSSISVVYDRSLWTWTAGNYTGQADDVNIIKADTTALSVGAWVRQRANGVMFQAASTTRLRDSETKIREIEVSIGDYAGGSANAGTAVTAALAALGTASPAQLVIPRGNWTISSNVDWSPYRNVTFVVRPGALIDNGASTVILPERLMIGLGAAFTGSGAVTQRNKDEAPLQQQPGGYFRTGNVAGGLRALGKNIGGHNNFAQGTDALAGAQYVRSAIAIGNGAQQKVVGDATGARARVSATEVLSYFANGDACVALGDTVLRDNLTGTECIGIGANALQQQTAGHCNVAVGANSQIVNANGGYNVSLGGYCLVNNTSNNNIAIGWAALEGQTTGSNVAIGHAAMNGNKTGSANVVIGPLGLLTASQPSENVVVGQEAAKNASGLVSGTVVGAFALGSSAGSPVNVTAIGRYALLNCAADDCTALGSAALSTNTTYGNCTGLGLNAQVTGANQVQLGDARATVFAYGAVQNRSDIRDKADVRDTAFGLDFINALRPVDYRWDFRDDYADWKRDGTKKRTRYHHGLIAQDVAALKAQFGDFGGLQHHQVGGGEDVFSLGYEELIAPLIKAVQQLSARVAQLDSK